jgi:phage tail sheath gpL-like
MAISFNQIPGTIGVPGSYVEFDGSGARTGQAGKPYSIMVFGQMDAAKTATYPNGSTAAANVPIQVQSAAQANTLFGSGSVLAHMAKSLFKTNSVNAVWFTPQPDDAAGVKRVVQVNYGAAYTVPAAFAGVERVYIGEQEYRVAVTVGDTASTIVANLVAAINADSASLFVATQSAALLVLTAKNAGLCSNDVQVVTQYNNGDASPAGAFALASQTTAGAQNPSLAAGIASVQSLAFTHVINPYGDATNYALLLAEAQDRWAPLPSATSLGNGQDDFIVFGAFRGTESQFSTFMGGRNSEYFTTAHIEPGQTINGTQYGGLMSSAWQYAAAYGALSAQLASVVSNNPLQNRVLNCLKPAPIVCRFPWNVRNRAILTYGGSTYKYNDANQVVLENGITENLTNNAGALTDAERRVETQLAKSYLRWSVRQMLDTTYPHSRLADNGTPGLPNNVATPNMIKGSILSLAKNVWVTAGVVENFEQFKASLIVERSTEDCNTIKFQMRPDLVNVLVVKAGQIGYIVC